MTKHRKRNMFNREPNLFFPITFEHLGSAHGQADGWDGTGDREANMCLS